MSIVITRTPLRISFFGGGTDYPDFYNKYGGEVLVSSIDKYSYIIVKEMSELFDYNIRVTYSKIEKVNTINDLEHPSMRECLKYLNVKGKLDIYYLGDLPAKSGLGSSSSFTVGFLNAINSFYGRHFDKFYYGQEAIHVEQNLIKENVGSQDQISTAIGGFNYIKFSKNNIEIVKTNIKNSTISELNDKLALFYYGNTRYANDILEEQISRTKNGNNTEILMLMKSNVSLAIDMLENRRFDNFGDLLNSNWQLKKKLSTKISNSNINEIYDIAMKNGALGGKLLGAGSGGFLLFYVPNKQDVIKIQNLIDLPQVDFKFENYGTSII